MFCYKSILLGIAMSAGLATPHMLYAQNNVTAHLEPFGNAAGGQYSNPYYRNVWDMQTFDGKIFIGSGDSEANVGPVRVWAFDPVSGNTVSEFTVDDEQIDRFRVIGGELYIPGHDATESWAFGNFYTRQVGSSSWTKHRTIPGEVHVYDMIRFGGRLFAGGGVDFGGTNNPTIQVSDDNGQTWIGVMPASFKWWRIYTMFEHGGEMYGSANNLVFKYNPATQQFGVGHPGADSPNIFPGASTPYQSNAALVYQHTHMRRPVNFLGHLVYVGGYNIHDHQWDPVGFYKTSGPLTSAQKITLTGNARVRDIIVDGGTLYALGEIKVGGNYIVTVNKTTDLNTWTEILRFDSDTFARSFEMFNGDLYFGMGTEKSSPKASSGNILRVQAIHFSGGGPVCGNNIVEAGEACDDGNTDPFGDSCSFDCKSSIGAISPNSATEGSAATFSAPVDDTHAANGIDQCDFFVNGGFAGAASLSPNPCINNSCNTSTNYTFLIGSSSPSLVRFHCIGGGGAEIESSSNVTVNTAPVPNNTPTANAGSAQTVTDSDGSGSEQVTLSGSASSDPDGDPLTYAWTGSFGNASGANPTVSIPVGTHTITLMVDDGRGGTHSDTVQITVNAPAPGPMPGTGGAIHFSFSDVLGWFGNIGNWIFVLAMLLVVIMIIIGATVLLTGGGDPTRVALAKKIFVWTAIGAVLALLAKGIPLAAQSIFGG